MGSKVELGLHALKRVFADKKDASIALSCSKIAPRGDSRRNCGSHWETSSHQITITVVAAMLWFGIHWVHKQFVPSRSMSKIYQPIAWL